VCEFVLELVVVMSRPSIVVMSNELARVVVVGA
jgi:hypothetical protein